MIKGEPIYINGDGETSRDFCFIANVMRANLLTFITPNPKTVNRVYEVAMGDCTMRNERYAQLRPITCGCSTRTLRALSPFIATSAPGTCATV